MDDGLLAIAFQEGRLDIYDFHYVLNNTDSLQNNRHKYMQNSLLRQYDSKDHRIVTTRFTYLNLLLLGGTQTP